MAKSKKASPDQPARIPVAGFGASAGGIEALREFFSAAPPGLGIAYVVIVHLAPDHASELAPILARSTSMSVTEVGDHKKLPLKPESVYVIAPDHKLDMHDGMVGATPLDEPLGRRSVIDLFFHSLADSHGDGYAIILSGGGSDGAHGAKAVKEAGGVVLVQDPREAQHEGMPRSVIAAEAADVVLPVRELAKRLTELGSGSMGSPAPADCQTAGRPKAIRHPHLPAIDQVVDGLSQSDGLETIRPQARQHGADQRAM